MNKRILLSLLGALSFAQTPQVPQDTIKDVQFDTFAHACSAAVAAHKTLSVISSWTALPTQTCAAPIRFSAGGMLRPAAGATVTLGAIEAGLYKIFDTSLGGSISGLKSPSVLPEWFGAVDDGVTNDAGAWVNAIAALPTTGGRIDASASRHVYWATNPFAAVAKPIRVDFPSGTITHGASIAFPPGFEGVGKCLTNGSGNVGAPESATVFKPLFNTGPALQLYNTYGVSLSCFTVDETVQHANGILIDSNNRPPTTKNKLRDFNVIGAPVAIQWGAAAGSAPNSTQSDMTEISHFTLASSLANSIGILVNGGNAGQQSSISYGLIYVGTNGNGIDAAYAASPSISYIAVGSLGKAVIGFHVTGGSGVTLDHCEVELGYDQKTNPNTKAVLVDGSLMAGVVLSFNQFDGDPVAVTFNNSITSINNRSGFGTWSASAAGATIVSINDSLQASGANHSWVVTNGARLYAWGGSIANPTLIGSDGIQNTVQAPGANPNEQFKNTSRNPSDWRFFFPGTSGISPGDFVLYDGVHRRSVTTASQALGAFCVNLCNNYASAGDLVVGTAANSGAIFFSQAQNARLDYGLSTGGRFTFAGGPIQATSLIVNGTSPVAGITYHSTGLIAPAAVAAQSCSDQTFTVSGLVLADKLGQITPPSALGNISMQGYVSATNTLLLHFCNVSATPVTPPTGAYQFSDLR